MEMGFTPGQMEGSIQDNILITKNMDLVHIVGLMEGNMLDIGGMGKGMGRVNTFLIMGHLKKVFGKMI